MQIAILVKDFNRLEPSVYLNDTLVLFFLKFVQNYVLEKAVAETVHIFNSFFMQMITQNVSNMQPEFGLFTGGMPERVQYDIQFNKIRRWTKNVDLFSGKTKWVIVPICENDHWSLAIIGKPYLVKELIDKHVQDKIIEERESKAKSKEKEDDQPQKSLEDPADNIYADDNIEGQSGGGAACASTTASKASPVKSDMGKPAAQNLDSPTDETMSKDTPQKTDLPAELTKVPEPAKNSDPLPSQASQNKIESSLPPDVKTKKR